MFRFLLCACLLAVAGCQTVHEKNLALITDRAEKLKPLGHWRPVSCRLEAHLTEPAIARYREMFPQEGAPLNENRLTYTWRARSTSCEVTPLAASPLFKNHKGFMEAAVCLLL